MRFSIKYKLITIIAIIVIPVLIFSFEFFLTIPREEKREIRQHNLQIAAQVSKSLDQIIEKSFGILNVLTRHPAVLDLEPRECDRLFAEILSSNPEFLNIRLADISGRNRGSGIKKADIRAIRYADSEWFSLAKKGRPVVSNIHQSKISSVPTVTVAMPVYSAVKKQIGVIGISLDLSYMNGGFLDSLHMPENSTLKVIDSKGNVIIGRGGLGKGDREAALALIALKGAGEYAEEKGKDGVSRLYSFATPANSGWKVIVGIPPDQAYCGVFTVSRKYTFVLILACLAALGTALAVNRQIVRNISALKRGMKDIEEGNLSFELKVPGHDELKEVADAFNRMRVERKKSEEKAREAASFLTSVLEGIGEGVVVIDRDFRIMSANRGYCTQVRMPFTEILGKHCYRISHHAEDPCRGRENGCHCTVRECFETGEHSRAIHTHFDRNGNARYIETNAYPLRNASGEVGSAIETLVDVTERVLLEKRLEEVKERYRKLYDDAPDLMHSIDKNGIVVVCNNTEANILGYKPEEIIGKPFLNIVSPESQNACLEHFELLQKKGFFEGEMTFSSRGGRNIPVLVRAKSFYDESGTFVMSDSVARDISEKKFLESQILHAQKMEAIGQLAGGIAHDFNNILTAIIGYASLLQLKMAKDDRLLVNVNNILNSAERAAHLTQSLLAFSRKQIIDPRPVNLNTVINAIEKLLVRLIGEDIELRTRYAGEDLIVMADAGQIDQVLINLATNSRDAMAHGGVLAISTETADVDGRYMQAGESVKPGRYAMMIIRDTGSGMDERTQKRIFEPFFTTKEAGKGTGLGLSIVYGIIKQHNGIINVASAPGKGTTFNIYLPLVSRKIKEAPSSVSEMPVRGTETILVAEDENEVRRLIKGLLTDAGYEVIEAVDGEDAVARFMENKARIQLLLFDVIMPKKTGTEAYDLIKKVSPRTKALFMSGYTADFIQKKGVLESGINFVSKPVFPNVLLSRIRNILDKD